MTRLRVNAFSSWCFSGDGNQEWCRVKVAADVIDACDCFVRLWVDPLSFKEVQAGLTAGGRGFSGPGNGGILAILWLRLPGNPIGDMFAVQNRELMGVPIG